MRNVFEQAACILESHLTSGSFRALCDAVECDKEDSLRRELNKLLCAKHPELFEDDSAALEIAKKVREKLQNREYLKRNPEVKKLLEDLLGVKK